MSADAARFPAREVRVADALRSVGDVRRHGGGRFGLRWGGFEATARLEGNWLRLEAERARPPARGEGLLEANAMLTGPAKWVGDRDAVVRLVADVACNREGLDRALVVACDSLAAALGGTLPPEVRDEADGEIAGGLAAAGWKANPRDDGSVTVDLEAARDYFVADVRPDRGGLACRAEVAAAEGRSPEARRAVSRLLLEAGSTLRLARGAASDGAERIRYRFEVVTPPDASVADLDRALRALSVAVDRYGPEARALARPELARIHAAVRGWTPATRSERCARQGAHE